MGFCTWGGEVTIDAVRQHWPWNCRVDVTYTVNAYDPSMDYALSLGVVQGGVTNLLSADAAAGTHQIQFDAAAMGTGPFEVVAELAATPKPERVMDTFAGLENGQVKFMPGDYLVVDVSGGTTAARYPVMKCSGVMDAAFFNTPEYKTTKIALRRIAPGKCRVSHSTAMGEVGGEATLTKAYYAGVFPITQAQFRNVMGYNPSKFTMDADGDPAAHRPVERVTWLAARANSAWSQGNARVDDPFGTGFNWPVSTEVNTSVTNTDQEATRTVPVTSFMGAMRFRTGLAFDLPTVTQWERAYYAGCTNDFFFAKDAAAVVADPSLLETYGWFSDNAGGRTHAVGGKRPNAWGLYDMAGNVPEWQLNWARRYVSRKWTTNAARMTSYWGEDPQGLVFTFEGANGEDETYGERREVRGGGHDKNLYQCAGSYLGTGELPYYYGTYYAAGNVAKFKPSPDRNNELYYGIGLRLFCTETENPGEVTTRTTTCAVLTRPNTAVFPETDFEVIDEGASVTVRLLRDWPTEGRTLVIPDDFGPFTLDLAGRTITGAAGTPGTSATPGGEGQPAIRLVAGDGGADAIPTRVTVVNGMVRGGQGGDGNPAGRGGRGCCIVEDCREGVQVDGTDGVAEIVDGTAGLTIVMDPGNGVARGVVYDGREHVPIEDSVDGFYTLSGDVRATAVGVYVVRLALADHCRWSDGSTAGRIFVWMIAKSPGQTALEAVFNGQGEVEPMSDDMGGISGFHVTVTNGVVVPLVLPDDLGPVTVDLNGHDLAGTNGVDAVGGGAGTDGGDAVVIVPGTGAGAGATHLVFTDSTASYVGRRVRIVGGRGGDGDPAGRGGLGYRIMVGCKEAVKVEGGAEEVSIVDGAMGVTVVEDPTRGASGTFAYNGRERRPLADGEHYTLSGDVCATASGTYQIVLRLAENCRWTDGTSEPKVFFWTIEAGVVERVLRAAFGETCEIYSLENGGNHAFLVTVLDDLVAPVVLPDDLGWVGVVLNGHDLVGTNGVDNTVGGAGTDGGDAIVVVPGGNYDLGPTVLLLGGGRIIGGKGGDGDPVGRGGMGVRIQADCRPGVGIEAGGGTVIGDGASGTFVEGPRLAEPVLVETVDVDDSPSNVVLRVRLAFGNSVGPENFGCWAESRLRVKVAAKLEDLADAEVVRPTIDFAGAGYTAVGGRTLVTIGLSIRRPCETSGFCQVVVWRN